MQLKEIESRLRLMTKVFMDGADPIVICDLEGRVFDLNHETERVFGWMRGEVVGRSIEEFAAALSPDPSQRLLYRIRHGETVRNLDSEARAKSGRVIPVLVTSFALTDETERPIGYAYIIKDISELRHATQRLEQKNRELQQLANALSHDLAAPLNSIRGHADLVRQQFRGALDEDADDWLDSIVEGVDLMDRMIHDLLDLSRIECGPACFEDVDCEQVFAQALANLDALIQENEAVVTHDGLPTVPGHPTQLLQLFQNLIGNAIKFRRAEPPRVRISCKKTEQGWEFSVHDNGIGIDSGHFDNIFDVFHRLHAESVFPGTGIGLAICRSIVERHGGTIWVESVKGQGSTFFFTIRDAAPSASPSGDPPTALRFSPLR